MKWLILILLTKGNPLVLDHRPFETEDECIAYVSDYNNAEEFAVEVIDVPLLLEKEESLFPI